MDYKITENKYNFDLSDLITIGNRANNPKRNFLFISKVIGKHLPISPNVCKAISYLLVGSLYNEKSFDYDLLKRASKGEEIDKDKVLIELSKSTNPNENTLVIGFAETATSLGMGVACGIKDSNFVTTTRENISDMTSIFDFEEEHSHATSHKCFLKDSSILLNADRIILVDDEITTGNTNLNLIKSLKTRTNCNHFSVLSILDWRESSHIEAYSNLEKELDITIDCTALIKGTLSNVSSEVYVDNNEELLTGFAKPINIVSFYKEVHSRNNLIDKSYISDSGIFGVSFSDIRNLEDKAFEIANKLKELYSNYSKILVVGHGEFMYIPSRIAAYLNADFKSTTRSPILVKNKENYPIRDKKVFIKDNIKFNIYNVSEMEEKYDLVLFINEDYIDMKLSSNSINITI